MKDPTKKSEWVLSFCTTCQRRTTFWRIRDFTFRCIECSGEREIRETDHDRDGMLE